MLGFSPLAASPLGDDGDIKEVACLLDSITTGNPVVGSSDVVQEHVFTSTPITTGNPVINPTSIAIKVYVPEAFNRVRVAYVEPSISRVASVNAQPLRVVYTPPEQNRTAKVR